MKSNHEMQSPAPRLRRTGIILAMMVAFAAAVAHAGDSAPFLLDTVTTSSTQTVDSLSVSWDASWIGGDAGATVVISDNGTEIKRTTGAGEFVYAPLAAGQHALTYTTYIGGVAQDEVYTATFKKVKTLTAAMVGAIGNVTYNGSAYKPEPVVTDSESGVTLENGTDYTLSWGANTAAGSGSVTVTGKGGYSGSVTKNFTIAPRDIADAVVTLGGSLTYNGSAQAQSVSSVQAGELPVTYSVSGNTATDAGSYTLTVTGTGNFTGSTTKQFTIARRSVAGATVTLGSALTYTGAAQSQSVSAVTIGGLAATFTVSGNSATTAGTYTLTVTGTGNFTGTTTKQFTIVPKTLVASMVGAVGNVTYTGAAHKPEPTVTDSARGVTLVKGTDYTLSWGANTAAGSGSVTVTGKGNYSGSISRTFTIAKQTVVPPVLASKAYTGGQQLATVPSSTLYDVAQNAGGVEVGQYDVKLRLVDSANFTWPDVSGADKIIMFTITKASNEWLVAPSIANWTYGGTPSEPSLGTAKFGTASVTYGGLGTTRPTDAGDYTATFTVAGTDNYTGLSLPVEFSIERRSLAGATVMLGPTLVFNGTEQTQTVTGVRVDGLDATYTVSGNKGTEAGTYTLTVTGTGNFTGTATKQWQIRPDGIVESVTSYDGIYDGAGHGIEVAVTKPDGAAVKYALDAGGPYAEEAILFTNVTEGAIAVWYTVEAENYTTVTNSGTVKISPKTLTDAMVTVEDTSYTYDNTAKTPTVTVADGEPSILTEDDYDVAYSDNVNAGTDVATVTVTGKCNYTGTVTKHFTIGKAEVTPPASVASKAYTGALLTADVSATTRYTVQNNGGVNVGSYPVVLTLTDSTNYRWKDGDSNPLSLTFSITKAANSWTTQPSIAGWTYGQAANAPNLGAAKFGSASVAYSATPQNAGSYTATFTVPETANYAGLTKVVPFTIAKATYDMSGARWSAGSFTYDGTEKSVIVEGLPSGVTVQSYADNAKTAAGNYTATVTLNYDATNFNAPVMGGCNWSIARKSLAGATVMLGPTLVFNGTEQTQTVTGVRVDGLDATYTVSGNKGTEAGSYTLTVTGTGNFTGTATKQWQIRPDGIVETVTSYDGIYDGAGHGIEIAVTKPAGAAVKYALGASGPYAEEAILFTNVTEGAVAVWYTVEAENYTTITNSGTVKISPKTLTDAMVTVEDVAYVYDGTAKTPTVTVADGEPSILTEDDYDVAYSDNVNAGMDTATVTVTGKGNYTGTVTKHFTIKSSEGSKLEDIFSDLPADVEPDGDGGWTVTITNDIDSADLPIEIPDNLGHVTIDLKGHDLIGANGANGDDATPGGDGKSAIRVVAGDGSGGTVTRLTIVTTDGDALVKGGDGGAGNPGGNGAAAVAVLGDCQAGVKIDVGAGVTVRGGRGGDSTTGDGGDGGAGVDGDVGTNDGTIVGGDGGNSESGDGGDGGMGVTGDVEENNGDISGGEGGESGSGSNGEDGPSVGGVVGGGSGTVRKIMVAVPTIPSVEYTGGEVSPEVPESRFYEIDAPRNVALPGTYAVKLTLVDPGNYAWVGHDGATVTVDFTVLNPPPRIQTEGGGKFGRENAASVTATYDGRGHGISVVVTYPESGATVRYSSAQAGPFVEDKPLFTNVVDGAETWYEVSAEGFDSVTNMATVTVSPKVLSAAMVTRKRLVEDDTGNVTAELSLSDVPPCVLTQSDWEYVSWSPRASGGGTATIRGVGNYSGSLAVDVPNELVVVFDAVYGDESGVRTATTQTPGRPYVLPPQAPQYRGYDFLGWFTEREGGEEVTSARTVSLRDPDVVYAHWRIRSFRTEFELNGGTGSFEPMSLDYGSAYPALPVPQKSGYLFDGWWTTPDFQKGTKASEGDVVPNRDTTLYAKWLRRRLWYSDTVFHLEAAATWDGYLIDTARGDAVVGTIMVKVGKPNKRTGIAKVTATVQMAGARKVTVKGETFDGTLSAKARDGRSLDLKLGASSMTGWFDGYEVDGALNVFTAKDEASKMRAAQELKLRQGVYTLAWNDAGWTGLSLSVAAKGKVKVTGTLANGTKVSAKSQLLVGERECAVAVSWAKKSSSVSFLMWFCEDGTVECANLPGGLSAMSANAREGAYLVDGAAFRIDAAAIVSAVPGAIAELLPDGVTVRMKGMKFDIDKGGRVKMAKDGTVDVSAAGSNPSGLKLTYKIKDCTFKGTFTVYANSAGRLKKVKMNVFGVVLGRKGYGTATAKGVGSVNVTIE